MLDSTPVRAVRAPLQAVSSPSVNSWLTSIRGSPMSIAKPSPKVAVPSQIAAAQAQSAIAAAMASQNAIMALNLNQPAVLAPSQPAPPPTIPELEGAGGPIRCLRKLGSGGFGTVWLARQTLLADASTRTLAVKSIRLGEAAREWRSSLAEELLGESDDLAEETTAEDVAREVHAHTRLFGEGAKRACALLCRLHGHVVEEERAVLLLEYFDGVDLHSHVQIARMHSAGWLAESEAGVYTSALCEALSHAHAVGVAHLDLKPGNVLVRPRDRALKLIDYGTAALFTPGAADGSELVEEHGGTSNYQSPERHFEDYVGGEGEEDEGGFDGAAADVWALGCVVFFMVHGMAWHGMAWHGIA